NCGSTCPARRESLRIALPLFRRCHYLRLGSLRGWLGVRRPLPDAVRGVRGGCLAVLSHVPGGAGPLRAAVVRPLRHALRGGCALVPALPPTGGRDGAGPVPVRGGGPRIAAPSEVLGVAGRLGGPGR